MAEGLSRRGVLAGMLGLAAAAASSGMPGAASADEVAPEAPRALIANLDAAYKAAHPETDVLGSVLVHARDKFVITNFIDEGSRYSLYQKALLEQVLPELPAIAGRDVLLINVTAIDVNDQAVYHTAFDQLWSTNSLGPEGAHLDAEVPILPYMQVGAGDFDRIGAVKLFDFSVLREVPGQEMSDTLVEANGRAMQQVLKEVIDRNRDIFPPGPSVAALESNEPAIR